MAFEPRIAVKPPPDQPRKTQLMIRTTPEEFDIITAEAKKRGVNKSQLIRDALVAYITED